MAKKKHAFGDCIKKSLSQYYKDMDGEKPSSLHRKVVDEVEKHLFLFVLEKVDGNRSEAASILGISRSTLRKKLKLHNIQ